MSISQKEGIKYDPFESEEAVLEEIVKRGL